MKYINNRVQRKNFIIIFLYIITSVISMPSCDQENVLEHFYEKSDLQTPTTWTFSESFDRSDGSIGNGWVEIVEYAGSSGQSGITSMQYRNKVYFHTSDSRRVRLARVALNFKEITSMEVSVKMYCGIGWDHNNDSLKVLLYSDNVNRDSATTGIGFHIVGGDRTDTGDGAFRTVISVDGVESSQATAGNLHVWRRIDFVVSDGTIKLFNYPAGDPRPDIPTIAVPYTGYTPQFENIVL